MKSLLKIRLRSLFLVGWLFGLVDYPLWANEIVWEFPRTGSCHEGLPFADGGTGVLVWGGGSNVILTVGRADFWDHRGGYEWTEAQNYSNIVSLVRKGDAAALTALFRKVAVPGEPINPLLLPFARVELSLVGAELKRGTLDTATGLGALELSDGRRVELAMGAGAFAMSLPAGLCAASRLVPAIEMPGIKGTLTRFGHSVPQRNETSDGPWRVKTLNWTMPAPTDPGAELMVRERTGELMLFSRRTDSPVEKRPETFAMVRKHSVDHWSEFWRKGAKVWLPDKELQEIFDYGMYKFGAMTDPAGYPAGLQGPWLEDDRMIPWNGDYHFNINVQECYSPAFRSGHWENLRPLFEMILSWRPLLRENARKFVHIDNGYVLPHSVSDRGVNIGGFWTGTIDHASTAWMADYMFRYVKYSRDMEFLRAGAYDFMKGAMNVYLAMFETGEDGVLALPVGPSPEWGGASPRGAVGRNPSFQLAAAHRLLKDLMAASAMLGEKADVRWADAARRLPLYNEGESGIMLFDGQALSDSHRHHSHLAALYPFDILDLNDANVNKVVARSLAVWDERGTSNWSGWCVPWAAIINVHCNRPEKAVELLRAWKRHFLNPGHGSLHDAWRDGFTRMNRRKQIMQMDGQCAAAMAVMELVAHDVNGKTEFFRGCPSSWQQVRFENLRLSDGRKVDGSRIDGKVKILPHK